MKKQLSSEFSNRDRVFSSNKHSMDRSTTSIRQSNRSRRTKVDPHRRSHDQRQELEPTIHVLDNGVDRTPLPLQQREAGAGGQRDSRLPANSISILLPAESSSLFHSSVLNSSTDQFGLISTTSLNIGSPLHGGLLTGSSSSFTSVSIDRRGSNVSAGSLFGQPMSFGIQAQPQQGFFDEPLAAPENVRVYTREERRSWLGRKTTVVLTETPTIMLYTHQDEIVSNENKNMVKEVQNRNDYYAALVEAKRVDEGTRFQEKGSWTFVTPRKSIHCAIHPPPKKNAGPLQVTTWMLRDQFAALTQDEESVEGDETESEEDDELVESVANDGKDDSFEATGGNSTRTNPRSAVSWMYSDSLLSTLRVMERAVVQNTMEEVQLMYRGITMDPAAHRIPRVPEVERQTTEDVDGPGAAEGHDTQEAAPPAATDVVERADPPPLKTSDDIKVLWTFRYPLTRNRAITSMAWNLRETDILAVGYSALRSINVYPTEGSNSSTGTGGIVCCWSLKNPLAPERVICPPGEAGVSCVAFSSEYPSLLAVGDTDGGIVIYDIQKDTSVPAIRTTLTSGQHTSAVWELKWVARGKERGEFLISISGDGRVVQWAVGKTIERVAPDLMTLKRHHDASSESTFANDGGKVKDGAAGFVNQQQQQQRRRHDALFSRQCGGMCLDISPADGTVYVVGTEDGSVYQCNKSQTENYELDYAPHSELVYRVRWSPYSDHYFLTCSADWSSRLYRVGQSAQLLTFESPNQNAVQDVAWSYTNSTTFATVTAQGNVELWSIADSIHPRSCMQFLDQRRLSSVLFAEQDAAVIVVGDEKGDVTVFRLLAPCYSSMNMVADEQEQALEEAIRKATS